MGETRQKLAEETKQRTHQLARARQLSQLTSASALSQQNLGDDGREGTRKDSKGRNSSKSGSGKKPSLPRSKTLQNAAPSLVTANTAPPTPSNASTKKKKGWFGGLFGGLFGGRGKSKTSRTVDDK